MAKVAMQSKLPTWSGISTPAAVREAYEPNGPDSDTKVHDKRNMILITEGTESIFHEKLQHIPTGNWRAGRLWRTVNRRAHGRLYLPDGSGLLTNHLIYGYVRTC